jgi:uncharacterized membrane protein YphA (DoxX/SURF4 family)
MNTIKYYFRIILTIALGLFFVYKGFGKLTSDKLKPIDEELLIEQIIENGSYAPPVGYNVTMNTFKQSGFLDLISIFQIIAGILILIPLTRLAGLLLLLPIIFNIFLMHVFFDNRIDENIVTGLLLAINLFLCSFYFKRISTILFAKNGMNQ